MHLPSPHGTIASRAILKWLTTRRELRSTHTRCSLKPCRRSKRVGRRFETLLLRRPLGPHSVRLTVGFCQRIASGQSSNRSRASTICSGRHSGSGVSVASRGAPVERLGGDIERRRQSAFGNPVPARRSGIGGGLRFESGRGLCEDSAGLGRRSAHVTRDGVASTSRCVAAATRRRIRSNASHTSTYRV